MTRFASRLFRKAAKVGMAALAAAYLTTPVVSAQPPQPVITATETNRLAANGDGHFRGELTLPAAAYDAMKKSFPDAGGVLRKLGLKNEESLVEGVKGEWADDAKTLRVEYTARGIARVGKDGAWGVVIPDGIDTKLVGVENGVAELVQSMEIPGVGTAASRSRVTLPAGVSDVKLSRDKARLTYRLPEPAAGGRVAKVEFDVDAKKHVLGSLAKVISNRKFANLWVTRSVFKNAGDAVLQDYRVRFRVTDFTAVWSPWAGTPLVVPGQTVVDTYHPVMDVEKVAKMTGQTKASVEVQWRYTRPDGKVVEDTETTEITLLARNQVQYSSMRFEECKDWLDAFDLSGVVMGAFVTHEDPVIQQAAGRLCKATGGQNAASSDEGAVLFMKAAYDFLSANVAYQTPPGNIADDKLLQHVKYGRDVLKNKAGTCIDLAILYASLCEAVGLKPVLFNIPGHCFPGVYLPKSGKLITVEATMVGKADFADAVNHSTEKNMKPIQAGKTPTVPANIEQLHGFGVHPLDLPALADDVLDKWGITFDGLGKGGAGGGTDEPRPMPQPAATVPVPVGVWRTTYRLGEFTATQTTVVEANGEIGARAVFDSGVVITRRGTYTMRGKVMSISLTDGTKGRGAILWNGKDEFTFEDDNGPSLVYRRVK